MTSEWIDVHDELPPQGQFVLIRHKYRLEEYGIPYAVGIRIRYHGSETARWIWVAGKCCSAQKMTRGNPLEWIHSHTLAPGDRYVTHWMPLPEEPQQGDPNA